MVCIHQAASSAGCLCSILRYPLLKAYDYLDAGSPPTWVLDDNNGSGQSKRTGGARRFRRQLGVVLAGGNYPGRERRRPGSVIAPNTWVEIKGLGLAPAGDSRIWKSSEFVNNQMPTNLDGVGATVNGKNAYIYYISATQVNIHRGLMRCREPFA